jgi:hypothetical protein
VKIRLFKDRVRNYNTFSWYQKSPPFGFFIIKYFGTDMEQWNRSGGSKNRFTIFIFILKVLPNICSIRSICSIPFFVILLLFFSCFNSICYIFYGTDSGTDPERIWIGYLAPLTGGLYTLLLSIPAEGGCRAGGERFISTHPCPRQHMIYILYMDCMVV